MHPTKPPSDCTPLPILASTTYMKHTLTRQSYLIITKSKSGRYAILRLRRGFSLGGQNRRLPTPLRSPVQLLFPGDPPTRGGMAAWRRRLVEGKWAQLLMQVVGTGMPADTCTASMLRGSRSAGHAVVTFVFFSAVSLCFPGNPGKRYPWHPPPPPSPSPLGKSADAETGRGTYH